MNVSNEARSDFFVALVRPGRDRRGHGKSAETGQKPAIPTAAAADAGWCSSCCLRHMETHKWLQRVALVLLLVASAVPAQAHWPDRVRPASEGMRQLISSGLRRSAT